MTKSATREAADEVSAPIASPVFTGNVGVGVTPESHHSTHTSLQVGGHGNWTVGAPQTASQEMDFQHNAYYSAGGNDKYIITDEATKYRQGGGAHYWYVAPSGTADSAISWTTAMTIKSNATVVMSTNGTGNHDKWEFDGSYYAASNRQSTTGSTRLSLQANGSQVGAIFSSGSGTAYNTTSDYRLKENVTPMSGAIARVKLLKPCNFDWISTGENVDGFLAHEAQEVVPEAVTGTKDAMMDEEYEVTAATDTEAAVMGTRSVPDLQGIDQSKLIPLLTATIQELIARIEALEGE